MSERYAGRMAHRSAQGTPGSAAADASVPVPGRRTLTEALPADPLSVLVSLAHGSAGAGLPAPLRERLEHALAMVASQAPGRAPGEPALAGPGLGAASRPVADRAGTMGEAQVAGAHGVDPPAAAQPCIEPRVPPRVDAPQSPSLWARALAALGSAGDAIADTIDSAAASPTATAAVLGALSPSLAIQYQMETAAGQEPNSAARFVQGATGVLAGSASAAVRAATHPVETAEAVGSVVAGIYESPTIRAGLLTAVNPALGVQYQHTNRERIRDEHQAIANQLRGAVTSLVEAWRADPARAAGATMASLAGLPGVVRHGLGYLERRAASRTERRVAEDAGAVPRPAAGAGPAEPATPVAGAGPAEPATPASAGGRDTPTARARAATEPNPAEPGARAVTERNEPGARAVTERNEPGARAVTERNPAEPGARAITERNEPGARAAIEPRPGEPAVAGYDEPAIPQADPGTAAGERGAEPSPADPSAPVPAAMDPAIVAAYGLTPAEAGLLAGRYARIRSIAARITAQPLEAAAEARALAEAWGVRLQLGDEMVIDRTALDRARSTAPRFAAEEQLPETVVREHLVVEEVNQLMAPEQFQRNPATGVVTVARDLAIRDRAPSGSWLRRPPNLSDPEEALVAQVFARATLEEMMHAAGREVRPGSYIPMHPDMVPFQRWLESEAGRSWAARPRSGAGSLSMLSEADAMAIHADGSRFLQGEVNRYGVRQAYQEFRRQTGRPIAH